MLALLYFTDYVRAICFINSGSFYFITNASRYLCLYNGTYTKRWKVRKLKISKRCYIDIFVIEEYLFRNTTPVMLEELL